MFIVIGNICQSNFSLASKIIQVLGDNSCQATLGHTKNLSLYLNLQQLST